MKREEFLDFLGSFKNAESLSPGMREAVNVTTGIETHLVSAIEGGKTIIITGSAGSGKTHLIKEVREQIDPGLTVITSREESPRKPHILIVPDATELTVQQRIAAVSRKSKSLKATVVAINEGPLREAARTSGGELYSDAVRLLHAGKRGLADSYDHSKPTIIDMGSFSPLEQGCDCGSARLAELG